MPIPSMPGATKHQILNYFIAAVWLINGLVCKVLNLVPRHRQIVERILGSDHAVVFTIIIGCLEILMAVWILSRFMSALNAIAQIIIIATMNAIEFSMAHDLLLWGRWNALFAFLFIVVIFYNEFFYRKKLAPEI